MAGVTTYSVITESGARFPAEGEEAAHELAKAKAAELGELTWVEVWFNRFPDYPSMAFVVDVLKYFPPTPTLDRSNSGFNGERISYIRRMHNPEAYHAAAGANLERRIAEEEAEAL